MRKQCKNKCEPIVKSISQLKSSKRTHTSCGLDCRHKPHYIEGVLLNEYFGVSNHFERRKTYRVCHNLHLQMKKSDCFKSDSYRNYSYKNAPRRSKRNDSDIQTIIEKEAANTSSSFSCTPACKPTSIPSPIKHNITPLPLVTKYQTLKVSYTDTYTIRLNCDNESSSSDGDDDDSSSYTSTTTSSSIKFDKSQSTKSLCSTTASGSTLSNTTELTTTSPSDTLSQNVASQQTILQDGLHDIMLLDPSSSPSNSDTHKLPPAAVYDINSTKTKKRSSKSQVINKILFAKFDRRLRRYKDLSKKRKIERARDLACSVIAACMSHGEGNSNCDSVYDERIVGNDVLFEDCIHLVDSMKFTVLLRIDQRSFSNVFKKRQLKIKITVSLVQNEIPRVRTVSSCVSFASVEEK